MGVKPAQLIGSGAAEGQAQERFVGIEYGELGEKFFGFASRFRGAQKRPIARERTGCRSDEFNDRLVGHRIEFSSMPRRKSAYAIAWFSGNRGSKR